MRAVLAVLILSVTPVLASAQTKSSTLPKNDATLVLGWSGAEHRPRDEGSWHGSLLVGLSGGHYWADHLKTEVEASWTRPRNGQIFESIERQGGYAYAFSDYRPQDIRFGIVQLYQFGRNEWIHPYVGLGADVVRRQATIERKRQSSTVYLQNRSIPVDIPALSERKTSVFAEAVIKSGLKMYVTERAFFNTELKLGVRDDLEHIVWKFGMGVDF